MRMIQWAKGAEYVSIIHRRSSKDSIGHLVAQPVDVVADASDRNSVTPHCRVKVVLSTHGTSIGQVHRCNAKDGLHNKVMRKAQLRKDVSPAVLSLSRMCESSAGKHEELVE